MFRTTFKIAWRNLSKNKVYSFINIGGLAVGMAVEAVSKVEAGFKKVLPSLPFDYKFIDEQYGLKFAKEERIG